jgi:alpha-D-xyloside xylohydrolase
VEYTAQEQDHALTLHVYTGADARFTLYEDEGTTYDYEKGAFSRIPIVWNEAERQLTIGAREGSFEGMPTVRTITVRLIAPMSVTTRTVTYTGTELTIQ